MKYILAKEVGYFPKTRSLSRLFKEVSKIDKRLGEFYEKNEIVLKLIEDAYILARYFPKGEVSKMIDVLKRFKKEFHEWL